MLTNTGLRPMPKHVKFISYTGKYPNFCRGILTLEIDNKEVKFGSGLSTMSFWCSGGGLLPNYEGTYKGEWIINVDQIPPIYRKYAREIDEVFNENVEWGCCGGCI